MAAALSAPLRQLLLATQLGLSVHHPLAGWFVLTILYRDAGSSSEPITLSYLARKYNNDYLDTSGGETPIADDVLKKVLDVLVTQAGLVEMNPRKVRARMHNGSYHIIQSYVYRITSSGSEYLKMMQKVIDAETTITANTNRIQEYVDLVKKLSAPVRSAADTQLYNDFKNMLDAFDDVMKGIHKLEDDLDELANDIAFNHGSQAASHLQQMLRHQAIPAYREVLNQASRIQGLVNDPTFVDQIAHSLQGSDDMNAAKVVGREDMLVMRLQRAKQWAQAQMTRLALSMSPTATAIDSSLDSIYLVFNTLLGIVHLLSQEFKHAKRQTIDIKALSKKLDGLLAHYQQLHIPAQVPRHLPADREVEDPSDLLDASTMGPVSYLANPTRKQPASETDNPDVTDDAPTEQAQVAGLREFRQTLMVDDRHGRVDHDLTLQTVTARDEIIKLFAATYHEDLNGFAPFGRPAKAVDALPNTPPLQLQVAGEDYAVVLPCGFKFTFA
ncbi:MULTISPECIES: hypothetical protein [Lacticaseibacillus]|uniref:Uncharacterized protein n=1 Tax=Lacticaseibacillus huelsenbergensis TaxID=3035291 RepID=A0ABY8DP50_9LACO|nr:MULTISPECIES: hypothetical protein [Lacticaseibacillus]MDG3061947.1 hypothetical protein [Lacticaseibacillus sp. BCRC 81376]WFB38754.1 hypothetical protein LHUE1_002297 [Lacticaseibacillus huelsenbergensis]